MRNKLDPKDPFDTSKTSDQIAELGVPTVDLIESLEENARVLYQASKGREAAAALERFAKEANWISNIIAAGLEPYYSANFDEQDSFPRHQISKLAKLEGVVNEYRDKRNRAMVMQAECLLAVGETEMAISILMNALSLISVDDTHWWEQAQSHLHKIIGLS